VAKGKYEIVKFLLKHGADPTKKNRDGMLPIDLCKDEDIADLLQGNSALLEAAKKGNLAKVKKLLSPDNVVSFCFLMSSYLCGFWLDFTFG
jgi:tankyrase